MTSLPLPPERFERQWHPLWVVPALREHGAKTTGGLFVPLAREHREKPWFWLDARLLSVVLLAGC